MTEQETLAAEAAARRRFSEISTEALAQMWTTDGRAAWAEAALRDELLGRGYSVQELDDVASRRESIALNAPPSVRDTLWKFGLVGRVAAVVAVSLWTLIAHATHCPGPITFLGALAVVGAYVYILTRRTSAHAGQDMQVAASFAMQWQLGEAWLILIGMIVVGGLASMH
jgi:hypothetical protein